MAEPVDPAECPVCFGRLDRRIATRPPCGHEVCLPCLMALKKRDCVLCRADLTPLFPAVLPRITLHVTPRHGLPGGLPGAVPGPSHDLLEAIRLARQADGAVDGATMLALRHPA